MIGTFKHKGLKAYFKKQDLSGIVPSHAARLDECLKTLSLPGTLPVMRIP